MASALGLASCDAETPVSEHGLEVEGVWDLSTGTFMFSETELERIDSSDDEDGTIWALGEGVAIPIIGASTSSDEAELPEVLAPGTNLELWSAPDSEDAEHIGTLMVGTAQEDVGYSFHFSKTFVYKSEWLCGRWIAPRMDKICRSSGGYAISNLRIGRCRWSGGTTYFQSARAYCWK